MVLFHVITLDGPVGVGKSSVARTLARKLGYRHIDTGAMYRAVTLAAMERHVDLGDPDALGRLAHECDIELIYHGDGFSVSLDGRDVSQAIRDPEVSKNTSPVADSPSVRKRLVSLQRRLGLQSPSVLEGRDISTVVFPDAFWKFFLNASLEERARRRALQLENAGKTVDFEETMKSVHYRDFRDCSRSDGPLLVAPDAIVIDTTTLSENDVIRLILAFIHSPVHPVQDG
ncbi:(d)CMP kinase [Candidatus Sumerlaeota bacterium]|nr:(d)CMP kinase [Candidatus Sumerlaeota bacterium]